MIVYIAETSGCPSIFALIRKSAVSCPLGSRKGAQLLQVHMDYIALLPFLLSFAFEVQTHALFVSSLLSRVLVHLGH